MEPSAQFCRRRKAGRTLEHMSHSGAILAVFLSMGAVACGDADPVPPSQVEQLEPGPTTEGDPNEAFDASGLDFTIDGRDEQMGAQARLQVREGDATVHLLITGGNNGDDYIMLDLAFDDVASSMGPHVVPFGLPRQGDNVANASFDGESFYSQGGEIDVSLSADGTIVGTFNVSLAHDSLELPGEEPVFEVSEDATALSGDFSGRWTLSCQSRLAGHQTFVPGGDYCEKLEF